MLIAPTPPAPAWHAAARRAPRRARHGVGGSCEAATGPPWSVLVAGNEKPAGRMPLPLVSRRLPGDPRTRTPCPARGAGSAARQHTARCFCACLVVAFSAQVAAMDAR